MPKIPKPDPDRDAAIKRLCDICRPGSTVYTLTTYGRGSARYVRCFVVSEGLIIEITGPVARATGYRWVPKNGSLRVSACGTSAGFDIVHALSHAAHGMPSEHTTLCGTDLNTPRPGYTLRQEDL